MKKIVVLDGHMENALFLTEGIDLALRDLKAWGIDGVWVLKMTYCEVIKQETLDNETSSCIGCGVCVSVCPMDTLSFSPVAPEKARKGPLVHIQPAKKKRRAA